MKKNSRFLDFLLYQSLKFHKSVNFTIKMINISNRHTLVHDTKIISNVISTKCIYKYKAVIIVHDIVINVMKHCHEMEASDNDNNKCVDIATD